MYRSKREKEILYRQLEKEKNSRILAETEKCDDFNLEEMDILKKNLYKAECEICQLNLQLKKALTSLSKKEKIGSDLIKRVTLLQKEHTQQKQILESLKNKRENDNLLQMVFKPEQDCKVFQDELEKATFENNQLKRENDNTLQIVHSLEEKVKQLQDCLDIATFENHQLKQENEELLKTTRNLKETEQFQKELDKTTFKNILLKQENENFLETVHNLEKEVGHLQEKQEMEIFEKHQLKQEMNDLVEKMQEEINSLRSMCYVITQENDQVKKQLDMEKARYTLTEDKKDKAFDTIATLEKDIDKVQKMLDGAKLKIGQLKQERNKLTSRNGVGDTTKLLYPKAVPFVTQVNTYTSTSTIGKLISTACKRNTNSAVIPTFRTTSNTGISLAKKTLTTMEKNPLRSPFDVLLLLSDPKSNIGFFDENITSKKIDPIKSQYDVDLLLSEPKRMQKLEEKIECLEQNMETQHTKGPLEKIESLEQRVSGLEMQKSKRMVEKIELLEQRLSELEIQQTHSISKKSRTQHKRLRKTSKRVEETIKKSSPSHRNKQTQTDRLTIHSELPTKYKSEDSSGDLSDSSTLAKDLVPSSRNLVEDKCDDSFDSHIMDIEYLEQDTENINRFSSPAEINVAQSKAFASRSKYMSSPLPRPNLVIKENQMLTIHSNLHTKYISEESSGDLSDSSTLAKDLVHSSRNFVEDKCDDSFDSDIMDIEYLEQNTENIKRSSSPAEINVAQSKALASRSKYMSSPLPRPNPVIKENQIIYHITAQKVDFISKSLIKTTTDNESGSMEALEDYDDKSNVVSGHEEIKTGQIM